MSELACDHALKTLTLFDRGYVKIGSWPANNNVQLSVQAQAGLVRLPNGIYPITPTDCAAPFPHNEKSSDAIGPTGIVRLVPFFHNGQLHTAVGVHAGRKGVADAAGRSGPNHATDLCVRANDTAMSMIRMTMARDPLQKLVVRNSATHGAFVK